MDWFVLLYFTAKLVAQTLAEASRQKVSEGRMNSWICNKCGYSWANWVSGCQNCNRPEHEKDDKGAREGFVSPLDLRGHGGENLIWSCKTGEMIHVIEKSAYDQAIAERDRIERLYKNLIDDYSLFEKEHENCESERDSLKAELARVKTVTKAMYEIIGTDNELLKKYELSKDEGGIK